MPAAADVARAIAARYGAEDVRLVGQGANNTVFAGQGSAVAVKLSQPHREAGALSEYRKEAWCVQQARPRGVRTPEVLETGLHDGLAFEVLAYVDGRPPAAAEAERVWRTLGQAARAIHAIPVEGWSVNMSSAGVFGEDWRTHLAYNIASLQAGDPLIALGVLDAASSARLRDVFERLAVLPIKFGLCHADLALSNTLIDAQGAVWLLDWGSAAAHAVPHYDINEILRGPKPPPEHLAAFLEGCGITPDEYAAMCPDLRALAALREVDTLRWALDQQPDKIAELTQTARAAVQALA